MSTKYKLSFRLHDARRARGFTLIELMIALSVLVILAAVGIPSFRGMIANNRLASASNDVIAGLNVAKSEAIRRNAAVLYCLNPTSRAWRVMTPAQANTTNSIRVGDLSAQVTVASAGVDTTTVASNACVRFRPNGVAYGSGTTLVSAGSYTLSLNGATTRVVRIRTGVIHVD